MSAVIRFSDPLHERCREATRRYRLRAAGKDAPLLQAKPTRHPIYHSKTLVPFCCKSCGNKSATRISRIKPDGNLCKTCAIKAGQDRRVKMLGCFFSQETRAKISEAKKGKPGGSKGYKRTPESMANAWAAAKLIPPEKRYRPKPRLDPAVRIMRERVRTCCGNMVKRVIKLQKAYKKTLKTFEYLGYTKADFIAHIESQFKPGMSWDNWGNYSGKWNVDHIKPIAAFLDEGITDICVINALANLQPLWANENYRKWRTYLPPQLMPIEKAS